ncbi:hypothetical protein MASR1M42_10390 [Azonexus hydrophilus]
MSAQNVISLGSCKAQNEATWMRIRKTGDNISTPILGLFVACQRRDQEMADKYMRELRAVAARELGLSEVSNQATKGPKP